MNSSAGLNNSLTVFSTWFCKECLE